MRKKDTIADIADYNILAASRLNTQKIHSNNIDCITQVCESINQYVQRCEQIMGQSIADRSDFAEWLKSCLLYENMPSILDGDPVETVEWWIAERSAAKFISDLIEK